MFEPQRSTYRAALCAKGLAIEYLQAQAPEGQSGAFLVYGLIDKDPCLTERVGEMPPEDYDDDEGPVPEPSDEGAELDDDGR